MGGLTGLDSPGFRSKLDVRLGEVEDLETGQFKRSVFAYVDENDIASYGEAHGVRKFDLDTEAIRSLLRRIPDESVYPKATAAITVSCEPDRRAAFVKRPNLLQLAHSGVLALLPRMLIEEAETLELIRQHPHPNLVPYRGCTLKDGRITGIVLKRYEMMMQHRFEDDPRRFNTSTCMEGIKSAVRHLHSVELAHNDLNPFNIALDPHDRPVLIDFGSCRKFGTQLLTGSTPDWIDEDYDTSAAKHDLAAILNNTNMHLLEVRLIEGTR